LQVEVLQESEEHFGAWFEAKVIGHKGPDKVRVEYEELCDDADEDADDEDAVLPGLKQDEPARRVRPVPLATQEARWLEAVAVADIVQLQYIGGWWDVKVIEVLADAQPPQWVVKSVHYEATHTVDASVLRRQPRWYWDLPTKSWLERGHEPELEERMAHARQRAGVASGHSARAPAPGSSAGKVPRTGLVAAADDEDMEVEVDSGS